MKQSTFLLLLLPEKKVEPITFTTKDFRFAPCCNDAPVHMGVLPSASAREPWEMRINVLSLPLVLPPIHFGTSLGRYEKRNRENRKILIEIDCHV